MLTVRKHLQSLSGLHWVVVVLSLLLTLTAWQVSSRIAEQKALEQFDHEVEQLNELIRDRMRIYEFALISGAGAIRSSGEEVNLAMWRRFSESLALDERLPGINGIGVIERVAPEALPSYIQQKKAEREYFRLHPSHERNDFWPIIYIEPEAANQAAVGLDMAHETNRYQAALKAMNSGQTQITGPITLVQDAEKTPGFLFYHPFYTTADVPPPDQREAELSGLVYAPFIMSKLMDGTLASTNRLVHVRITDAGTSLFSELDERRDTNFDETPMFATSYDVLMYGRQWHFDVQTTRLFETFNASKQPIVILIGGIVIDAFILLVFALMANARRRAERRVEETTAELRESLEFISTLTDNLPLAVSVWDRNLSCRFMNASGERWFSFDKNDAIGQPLERFLGPEVVEQRRDYYRRALEGEPVQASASFPDREGNVRDVVVSYYPVTLGGERCFMATTMDVTALVQREKDLERLNKELEVQKQEAESAVTVKTAFLANMSHEIRTPMNAIIGVLVLLQEAGLEEHPKRLVRKAFAASEALLQLLNDILDLSKIEADRIELDCQAFDIESLVHRSVDLFAMVAEEKQLRLKVKIDPVIPKRVVGDQLRISQICTNLVGNAIKFTRQGGVEVRFGFQPDGEAQGHLTIDVEDTGVGIRAEDQDRIFENFRQADETTSRHYGGTGLGLSISRKLSELMHGSLTLESTPGEGATFRLSVPVTLPEEGQPPVQAGRHRPIRVFHYGFETNLAVLTDHQEHWKLRLEPLDDLKGWPDVMDRIAWTGESEDVFLVIDLEGAARDQVDELLAQVTKKSDQYPLPSVLIVVPAGCSDADIVAFQRAGGRVAYEPLTPSRLYEHFSPRARSKPDLQAAVRPKFPGLAVLVVDDVSLNCEIVESYLRSFGVDAESVQTGDHALERLGRRAFDLVLMDLHLEGETGQEVAERINRSSTGNKPIIAALSASISDADRKSAKAAGMEDYLTKPVVPRDIQLLLETYFSDSQEVAVQASGPMGERLASKSLPAFISPEAYEQLFGQDPTLFLRCVRSFVASSEEMVAQANDCSDPEAIRRLAHKIKGAAGNIADTQLARQAETVESNQDDSQGEALLISLIAVLDDHARRLGSLFKEDHQPDNGQLEASVVKTVLERMKSRLGRHRIVEDSDIRIVMKHLMGSNQGNLAQQLRRALEAFNFREALVLLDQISSED